MKVYYFLITVIAISLVIFSHSQFAFSEIPFYFVKTVDIDSKPSSAAINENTNQIYVSDFFKSRIIVINGISDKIIEFIPASKTPFGIGVNSATNIVYVGGEFSNITI